MKPGLGSARCPRCLSLVDSTKGNWEWKINPVLHDATAVAGSGIGGMLSAVHGFNTEAHEGAKVASVCYWGMTGCSCFILQPSWNLVLPPLLMYSAANAAFGGSTLPKFTQLAVTSYFSASSSSHYGISLRTRHIEEDHVSRVQHKELR